MGRVRRKIKRNAPTIMAVGNAVGVIVTGVLTAYGTVKAVRKYDELKETVENPTKKEILKAVVPCYISPAISAALTIGLGITSNSIHIKRQQALSAALIASNEALQGFKQKTIEKIGDEEVKKIVEEQAKEAVVAEEPKKAISNDDYITVYDEFSGYKFQTTKEKLFNAEVEVNRRLNHNDNFCCVGEVDFDDFFRWMGVQPTLYSKAYAWESSDMWDTWDTGWIDFYHEETMDAAGKEIIILRYSIAPVAKTPGHLK